jgi:hypothetical protein
MMRNIAIAFLGLSVCWNAFGAATDAAWNVDANGSWKVDSNWAFNQGANFPNGIDHIAHFEGKITAPRTVFLDQDITVGTVLFATRTHIRLLKEAAAISSLTALQELPRSLSTLGHTRSAPR